MKQASIVVLTPIKNEEWILGPFLQACSEFADHIILLVQDTHDRSREIAAQYPKAHVIENTSSVYSEHSRIVQLLDAARSIEPGDKVLVALDADEIPMNSPAALAQWETIRTRPRGSNITFKKPDLLAGGERIVDLQQNWHLGFVDDGRAHDASEVHAQRIPIESGIEPFHANEIAILHLNLVREQMNRAKRRMYCVIENVNQSLSLLRRLYNYAPNVDFSTAGEIIPLPSEWSKRLNEIHLEPTAMEEEAPFWQDYEVLKYFKSHGIQRFYWDDIWEIDWEQIRQQCLQRGWNNVSDSPIQAPSKVVQIMRKALACMIKAMIRFKRSFDR